MSGFMKHLFQRVTTVREKPRIEFSEEEVRDLLFYTRSIIEHALDPSCEKALWPESLLGAPAYGVFVTLRRKGELRACRGQWGSEDHTTLEEMLSRAASDSATLDYRFSPIKPEEVPLLDLEISVMHDPKELQNKGQARAQEIKVGEHGVAIIHPQGVGLLLPQVAEERGWTEVNFLEAVSQKAGLFPQAWLADDASLISFRVRKLSEPAPGEKNWKSTVAAAATKTTTLIRRPAVSGQFYPSDLREAQAALQKFLRLGTPALEAHCEAIILPHAGWVFCGEVVGKTLCGVTVPKQLILLGPRHTGRGARHSIAAHNAWDVLGALIPLNRKIAAKLAGAVSLLTEECEAHEEEHCLEVLLPFLVNANPEIEIVPIVIGKSSYAEIAIIAAGLTELLSGLREQPLLVISSDMNHFASDAENRRLDQLALEALKSGEPRKLYDVCRCHDISMCGMLPTVIAMEALKNLYSRLEVEVVSYETSAKASGDPSRVVGYAGARIRGMTLQ